MAASRPLLAAALIALLLVPALASAADRTAPFAVGDLAPDFGLTDHQGRSFRLSDALRAREFVVLAFYVKAFTGG